MADVGPDLIRASAAFLQRPRKEAQARIKSGPTKLGDQPASAGVMVWTAEAMRGSCGVLGFAAPSTPAGAHAKGV